MGLFGPVWNTKDITKLEKVCKGIDKISDQDKLKEIVIHAPLIEVKDYALDKISDENKLFEIITYRNLYPTDYVKKVMVKIHDQNIIDKLLKIYIPTDRYFEYIYDNIENPPYDISIQMSTKKAEENIIKDLNEMEYPKDRDNIIKAAKRISLLDVSLKGIELLPIEEKDLLIEIYNKTKSIKIKLAIIDKFSFNNDRDFFENILRNGDKDTVIIKNIARKLDSKDPLLDKEVCPQCGAVDSIHLFDEYRSSIDLNVRGYSCDKCNYESLEQTGLGELKVNHITLREFIEK